VPIVKRLLLAGKTTSFKPVFVTNALSSIELTLLGIVKVVLETLPVNKPRQQNFFIVVKVSGKIKLSNFQCLLLSLILFYKAY
jgi:hypothetical protein